MRHVVICPDRTIGTTPTLLCIDFSNPFLSNTRVRGETSIRKRTVSVIVLSTSASANKSRSPSSMLLPLTLPLSLLLTFLRVQASYARVLFPM